MSDIGLRLIFQQYCQVTAVPAITKYLGGLVTAVPVLAASVYTYTLTGAIAEADSVILAQCITLTGFACYVQASATSVAVSTFSVVPAAGDRAHKLIFLKVPSI